MEAGHAKSGDAAGGDAGIELTLDPRHCMCNGLRRTGRAVTQLYDGELRPSGMRATQFSILGTIHGHGEANLALLARELLLDQTTLTRSLRLLETKKWLQRVPKPDARMKTLALTPAGLAALHAAMPLWEKAQRRMLAALGAEAWAEVEGRLERLAKLAGE